MPKASGSIWGDMGSRISPLNTLTPNENTMQAQQSSISPINNLLQVMTATAANSSNDAAAILLQQLSASNQLGLLTGRSEVNDHSRMVAATRAIEQFKAAGTCQLGQRTAESAAATG